LTLRRPADHPALVILYRSVLAPALYSVTIIGCLVLAGCSGDGGSPAPGPSTEPAATAAATPGTGTPAGTQPVAADETVNLGTATLLSAITGAGSGDIHSDLPPLLTGDFNGDGIPDVLLGARFGDGPENGRQDAGEVYLIYGRPQWPAEIALSQGQQDVTIWGPSEQANLGFSAVAEDLNGDGVDDMILGAPFTTEGSGPARAGTVHVIFGRPGLPREIDLATSPADVTLSGPGASSFFGDDLATGDVNGDALPDLIVGSTFAQRPADTKAPAGIAYVLYGRLPWPATLSMAAGEFDVSVLGAEEFDELGDTVASGDFNGDGIDDIAVTAEAADGPENSRPVAAEVVIVLGSAGLPGTVDVGKDEQDVIVLGAGNNDTLGFSLEAGDVTGDGFDDLLMGARGDSGDRDTGNRVGAVYMLTGAPELPASVDLAVEPLPAVYGAESGDILSHALIASVGGRPYAVLGAPSARAGSESTAGAVYLLDGETMAGIGQPRSISQLPVRLLVEAAASGDSLGRASAIADVNGDGQPELLLLASLADGPGTPDAGRVYLLPLVLP
jgi:hypothetical protein